MGAMAGQGVRRPKVQLGRFCEALKKVRFKGLLRPSYSSLTVLMK